MTKRAATHFDASPSSSWPRRQGELFQERLAMWLGLRSQLELLKTSSEEFERQHADLSGRLEDAARLAMTTLAPEAWMVWRKFEILETAVADCAGDTDYIDFRQIWMIAAIKADVAYLGLRSGQHAGEHL